MATERILYTDGHDVIVTDTSIKVKKSLYQLKGITGHRFLIIRPDRLPALTFTLVGAVLVMVGIWQLVPEPTIGSAFSIGRVSMTGNSLAMVLGVSLVVIGLLIATFTRERYAIRIATAEGEKNVVVSPKKEYIALIEDALNHAFLSLISEAAENESNKTMLSQKSF